MVPGDYIKFFEALGSLGTDEPQAVLDLAKRFDVRVLGTLADSHRSGP
jgi:hypothetical protein